MAGTGLAWVALILAVGLPALAAAAAPTGLNLPRLDILAPHYGGSWASASSAIFTNLFKHSTPFECQSRGKGSTGAWGWGPGEALTWRADGYPSEIKSLNTWTEYCAVARVGMGAAYYPAGTYVLLYTGDGKVTVDGDATVSVETPGRLELNIKPAAGFAVRIVRTNITNPVRNISIVPAAAETSYAQNPYQASFLDLVKGFDVLRFTWWQRIWGDARNAQMNRTLAERATPASQCYLAKDGVSWEDMLALANQVGADPWLNLPVAVGDDDPYANAMASFFAKNLAPARKVYIEYGFAAPGWMTTEYPTNLLRVARIWRAAFTAAGADSKRVVVVATYEVPAWIPYLTSTFGANISQVDAVAVVGSYGSYRSWNSNRPCFYDFSSNTFAQDPKNAGIDLGRVLSLTRSSVIHADLLHNSWHQRLKAMGKRFIAVQGGPDRTQMVAAVYSMRANYNSILGCRTYPCTRSGLFPPANPTSVTFASEAERNATLALFWPQAQNEWKLDELLMQARLREPTTMQHMLDHLWRWNNMGNGNGDIMIVDLPPPIACYNAPLSSLLPPKECQAGSGISNAVSPADSPIYQAVRAFQAGQRGSLPLFRNWSALEGSSCDPACQYGTCVKGNCTCWAGYTGATCSSKTSRPNQCNTVVGLNLEGVRDWMHSWTFVDVMKAGRGWLAQNMDGSGGWGNFSGVPVDSNGWVTKLWDNMKAGTMMIRDLQAHVPAGTYTILYDGEGVIDCSMDIDVIRQLEAGRFEVDLKPSTGGNNGLYCTLERTNPDNPVRNIRVLMPGFDAQTAVAIPFHPRFVKYVQNFGVLRFMAWMETNSNQLPRTWDERAKPTDRSFAGVNLGGVPVEHMVLLANMVGAAPWFSMPHLADDNYHRSFAQYVKDNLRPDVKVYVEWSNEVWHTGFAGGQFAQAEGVRLGMNEEGNKWYGGATNEARLCYYSERTKNMSIIWRDVFGDQRNRVVVVAQGQAVWPLTSDKVLKCRNATGYIDALAVGPYFGSYSSTRDTDMTTYMGATLPAQVDSTINSSVLPHVDIAAKYGKPVITYEAGSGISGTTDFPVQANRHPGMYSVYQRYFAGLVRAGVQLINQFDSMGGTTWGLSEWQDQDPKTAPKLQAVQDYIAVNVNASSCTPNDGGSDGGNSSFTDPVQPGGTCPNDCSGNGECLDSKCFCNTGFSGPDCNTTSPTDVYQCGYRCTFDQGVCKPTSLVGSSQFYGCTCSPFFSGLTCSLFGCPNNCSWSGSCIEPGLCACWPGFTGAACETDCGCNGHGMCTADDKCACDQGWKLGPSGCEPECLGCGAAVACAASGECGCASCKYGTCYNGHCECWAGFTGQACDVAAPDTKPNYKSPMAVEVASPTYWSSQWIWIDAMKQSSAWMTQNLPDTSLTNAWDTQDNVTLRGDGYPAVLPPGKLAHKLLIRNVQLHAMPGRYVCLYDGDGTIDIQFDAKIASIGKGRIEFDYVPTANMACHATGQPYCGDNGISLRVMATNPANPIRNIRLLPPGFEGVADRQVFHPWFLASLERFSVLRFMSWMNTNSDSLLPWEQRITPASASQAHNTGGGVALEHIADLCNRLGASPWINVHHLADDMYVRKLAMFLKDNLRPDVKVYVEHSNEVWNQGFPQGKFARDRGLAQGLSTQADLAGYIYHGKRSAEIWAIFEDVFGGPGRLQKILSTWGFVCSGSWGTGCGVVALNASLSYGNVVAAADAVAVAGYFDCGLGQNPTLEAQTSVDALIAQCLSEAQLNRTRDMLLTMKGLAAKFGLPLATYEGGPSILEGSVIFNGGGTAGAADKYIALQRDPRFQQVYEAYLAMFDSIGLVNEARPFMQFTSAGLPSKYGSWGLIEYTGQAPSTAPKYRAVMGLLNKKQPAGIYPGCYGPDKGPAGLGDASFFGVPAVLFPRKGGVLVQGAAYNITMPASHAATGDVTLSLFQATDCSGAMPLATSGPFKPQSLGFEAFVPFTVPASAEGAGFFLRIESSATGQRNYSEVFVVQKLQVQGSNGCIVNPLLPPTQPFVKPPNHCNPEYRWNISSMPAGICEVMANGGRYYRTSNKAGAWYSISKPVYDYAAQYSGSPSYAALAAAGAPVGPLKPGQPCT